MIGAQMQACMKPRWRHTVCNYHCVVAFYNVISLFSGSGLSLTKL